MTAVADIGVIGGSGFYEFLTDAEEVTVETPFGQPSETVLVGDVAGRRVAFLPRHGRDHRYPPHKIPYRANLWALRALGVRRILAPSAVGSLTASYGPGTLVVPDQLVDRTAGPRADLLRRVRGARLVRRPVLPVRPRARDRGRAQGRLGARRVRHAGGHRRPALLHPRGVALVRGPGLDADRDDRAPRGGARPRARALLHDAGAGHRHRRGRGRGRRGRPRPRCSRCSART